MAKLQYIYQTILKQDALTVKTHPGNSCYSDTEI